MRGLTAKLLDVLGMLCWAEVRRRMELLGHLPALGSARLP